MLRVKVRSVGMRGYKNEERGKYSAVQTSG